MVDTIHKLRSNLSTFDRDTVVDGLASGLCAVLLLVVFPYWLLCGCRRRPFRKGSPSSIRVERTHSSALVPIRQNSGGYVFYSLFDQEVPEEPCPYTRIRTGIRLQIPTGHVGILHPSPQLIHHGFVASNTILDQIVTTEVMLVGKGNLSTNVNIRHGDPVAVLVLQKVSCPSVIEGPLSVRRFEYIRRLYSWTIQRLQRFRSTKTSDHAPSSPPTPPTMPSLRQSPDTSVQDTLQRIIESTTEQVVVLSTIDAPFVEDHLQSLERLILSQLEVLDKPSRDMCLSIFPHLYALISGLPPHDNTTDSQNVPSSSTLPTPNEHSADEQAVMEDVRELETLMATRFEEFASGSCPSPIPRVGTSPLPLANTFLNEIEISNDPSNGLSPSMIRPPPSEDTSIISRHTGNVLHDKDDDEGEYGLEDAFFDKEMNKLRICKEPIRLAGHPGGMVQVRSVPPEEEEEADCSPPLDIDEIVKHRLDTSDQAELHAAIINHAIANTLASPECSIPTKEE